MWSLTDKGQNSFSACMIITYRYRTFILKGSLPLKELYGRFPEFLDVMAVIRNIYGDDFIEIFERSFKNFKETIETKEKEKQMLEEEGDRISNQKVINSIDKGMEIYQMGSVLGTLFFLRKFCTYYHYTFKFKIHNLT